MRRTMHKGIAAAQRHPTNRSLEDFRTYWRDGHGPLGANVPALRRYVQHITLPEAYGHKPLPTFDGVSMMWFEGSGIGPGDSTDPMVIEMGRALIDDGINAFDQRTGWPAHQRRAFVTADERLIVDGATTPEMVKAVFIVAKLAGLSLNQFFDHWEHEHAELVRAIPGLRRYVQNHAVRDEYPAGTMTHDGFAELWFDDLASLEKAAGSAEWAAAETDGETLFAPNVGVVVAREVVQKDFDWTYHDFGVGELDEEAIRERLRADGYTGLAEDPDAPGQIKKAAANGALVIWNELHLVTIDESGIDVRPGIPNRPKVRRS